MKNKIFGKNKYTGFTLIEIIIVLAIAAGLIAVVFSQASKAKAKSQVNQMRNNLTDFRTGIQSLYQNDPNKYTNISIGDIVQAGVVPTNLTTIIAAVANITDQFGQSLLMVSAQGGSYFTITYQKVPSNVCVGLLTAMSSGDFNAVTVGTGGTVIMSDGTLTGIAAQTILGVTAINTACANGPVAMNFSSN